MERSKIMLIRMSQIAFVVLAIGLFSGCGSQPILTKEARAGINSVSINREVSLSKGMCWERRGGGGGGSLLLATVGVAVRVANLPRRKREIRTIHLLMRKNNIVPGRIITTQFKEQLETKQVFLSIVETNGDATFTFRILDYGLLYDDNEVWPSTLKPVLTLAVYLKKPDGTLIWENLGMTDGGTEEVDAYSYNEYIKNPALLRKGFEQSASVIVGYFVRNLEITEQKKLKWYNIIFDEIKRFFGSIDQRKRAS